MTKRITKKQQVLNFIKSKGREGALYGEIQRFVVELAGLNYDEKQLVTDYRTMKKCWVRCHRGYWCVNFSRKGYCSLDAYCVKVDDHYISKETYLKLRRSTLSTRIHEFFKANRLTEDIILQEALTDAGASLYGYMTMLYALERKEEADLLHKHRTEIFVIRDSFTKNRALASSELRTIAAEIAVHYKLLRVAFPKEAECLNSSEGDLLNIAFHICPEKNILMSKI